VWIPSTPSAGVTDHGALTGLADDDHPQYLTTTAGTATLAPIAKGVTGGDSHDHAGGDGAQINHAGLANLDYASAGHSGFEPTLAAASDTVSGKVELAIASEVNAGTSVTLAVTPDSLAGSNLGIRYVEALVIEPASPVVTGDGKAYLYIPAGLAGYNLVSVAASLCTVQSSSGAVSVAVYNVTDSQDMLSVNCTIDASAWNSVAAATPPTINFSYDDVANGDLLRFDIDGQGTGAKGLIVVLGFQLP
jgi:hypothetical protein